MWPSLMNISPGLMCASNDVEGQADADQRAGGASDADERLQRSDAQREYGADPGKMQRCRRRNETDHVGKPAMVRGFQPVGMTMKKSRSADHQRTKPDRQVDREG